MKHPTSAKAPTHILPTRELGGKKNKYIYIYLKRKQVHQESKKPRPFVANESLLIKYTNHTLGNMILVKEANHKDTSPMIPFLWNVQNTQTLRDKKWISGFLGLGKELGYLEDNS